MKPYDQPSKAPVPKVAAVGYAGAIITAIVTLLTLLGVTVPENVSTQAEQGIAALLIFISAVQAVVTFAAGYFKRDTKPVEAVKVIVKDGK